MTHLSDVKGAYAPGSLAHGTRGLIRWVCTSNPFYVLSALMVLLGLWSSFGAQASDGQTWALMFGLAGYTLLLAVPACLLVRFGGVWEDVRTVLLLVVLMFLATSVTLDETLARDATQGTACYLAGFVFAVAVSEGMLRGMRLALPAAFRIPYYALLALFFLYPVALVPLLDRPRSAALEWALFAFSPVAGLISLTLLPAIRRGAALVRDNGSPWRWPWYPWPLFVFLAFGVVGRSFLLCWSMQHVERSDPERLIFGPYFLVPFVLAVAVLLLEAGLVARHRGACRTALSLPVVLIGLAMVGYRSDPLFQGFLDRFIERLGGTPLYLTLVATMLFYAYAAVRRVPLATEALAAALAVLAFVGPATLNEHELTAPRPLPILALGGLQLGLGLYRGQSGRCLVGSLCLVLATTVNSDLSDWLVDAIPFLAYRGAISYHLSLIAVLAVGAAFDGALARSLRSVGAVMVVLACLAAPTVPTDPAQAWVVASYPPLMAIAIAVYGWRLGHRASILAAALALCGWVGILGWRLYVSLRRVIVGLDAIAVGLVLLALAELISLGKAGLLPRFVGRERHEAPDASG